MAEKKRTHWRDLFLLLVGIVLGMTCIFWEFYSQPQLAPLRWKTRMARATRLAVGPFRIHWDNQGRGRERLSITHRDEPKRVLWQSVAGRGFVAAAKGREHVEEARGSFFIRDRRAAFCEGQTIDSLRRTRGGAVLRGRLRCQKRKQDLRYTVHFSAPHAAHLRFQLSVSDPSYNRVFLRFASHAREGFFGFGEQFSTYTLKGRRLPIFIMEQGIGRGAQPITTGANVMARAGGDWHTSYAGVPHFITSSMRSMFLENSAYSVFDLRPEHFAQVMVFSSKMTGRLVYGKDPLSLIERYTAYSGRMRVLPDWIHKGAIIGMQGGTKKVRTILHKLKKMKAPVAAFWLQDWVGQRKTSFGKQLWWNWELDRKHYPEWEALVGSFRKIGARVLLYINPFLADVKEKPHHRRNLFEEAKQKGLLIKKHDGKPYMILNTSFSAGLLDLSDEKARSWIKGVIRKEMLSIGADGWMADFGEALPYDVQLHAKLPASKAHNLYPVWWAKVNREVIKTDKKSNDIVFFMRAGYTQSPKYSTLFWLGDQLVSWDRHDGLKTAVTGLLSSGLSGFSLNHSDIGGYTTITNPIANYHRSKELHMRWAELSAFNTVFRTHEGNQPSKNHQFHSSDETFAHFVRCAKIYAAWAPYRKQLVKEAATRGIPVIRHPFLHYPHVRRFHHMSYQQFMIGGEWMVAPVLSPGQTRAHVWLPRGTWVHLWTGKTYTVRKGPWSVSVDAPLGQPAMFYLESSKAGKAFRKRLKQLGLL